MYSRYLSEFPPCSCELLFSAGLWLQGLREHQPLQDSPLCRETGLGGRAAGEESREGGIITSKSCWPLQREGLWLILLGAALTQGKKQHCLSPPSCMQLEPVCSLGPGLFPLYWSEYVQNGCNIFGYWALSALNCSLRGNEIMSFLFLHNSLPEARMHQGWANKLHSDSDVSGI